jgi:hypothetical protein
MVEKLDIKYGQIAAAFCYSPKSTIMNQRFWGRDMKNFCRLLGISTALILASCTHRPAELNEGPTWRLTAERDPIPEKQRNDRTECSEQRTLDKMINETAGFTDDTIVVTQSYPQIKCATKR